MNFSYRDGKRLSSQVWHQDELLNKKRRWLVGPVAISMTGGSIKKFKRPKFLTDVSLRESYVRSDEKTYNILKEIWMSVLPQDGSSSKRRSAFQDLFSTYQAQVSCENVRANVEKSFGAPTVSEKKNHVVKDYLQFFESLNMETYSINPSHFLRNLCSMMNVLSNNALCLVANLVTDKKVRFAKTRPIMKRIIRDYLPKVLEELSYKDYRTPVEQLSEIFRDPSNFRNKELTLLTPVSLSLLSSIHKALEELDEMPLQDLVAMNRKLKDITVVPQFPPARPSGPRNLVLERVKKRCQKVLSTLKEGTNLPKPFAKALSIVHLSLKHKTRRVDIMATEFYPFSLERVGLQNDILGALWSLPRVRIHELKALQPIVDPKCRVPVKTFRIALRKYLMEYLFDCDDVIDIPDEALSILASLNRRSRRSARLFSVGMADEDIEAALNISSQLKQTVLNLLPADRIDENSEALGSDDDTKSNDFDFAENSYLSNTNQQDQGFCLNDRAEGTGDSCLLFYSANSTDQEHPLHLTNSCMIGNFGKQQHILEQDDPEYNTNDQSNKLEGDDMVGKFIKKLPVMEQDNSINPSEHYPEQVSRLGDFIKKYNLECDDMHCSQHCPDQASTTSGFVKNSSLDPCDGKDPSQHCAEEALGSADMREILIQEICDETSLVAYGLIGHMLDKFLQVEDRDTNEMTRSYLRGGSSLDCPGIEEIKNSSKEDMGTRILIQSVKELLPNVPKSCIERVKKLMG